VTELLHRRLAVNGVTLHVAEQGAGPLVLLLHGFPECWYSWRHQLPYLAARGFHAVAPDLRGYGASDAPADVEAYDHVTIAGDVAGLVERLAEGPAAVVGHDLGAVGAWLAALLYPDLVGAVAAMSVPFGGRPATPPLATLRAVARGFFYIDHFQAPGVAEAELEADVRRSLRMIFYSASGEAPAGAFRPHPTARTLLETLREPAGPMPWLAEADLDVYEEAFRATGFRGALNGYRNLDRTWHRTAALDGAQVTQPALFIAGERDPVLALSGFQMLRMPSVVPRLRQPVPLPGCGHWTQQERPDEVNEALVAFLRSVMPPTPPRPA
jgi:pimeloyl-ACP methyl ester carboxylesterase